MEKLGLLIDGKKIEKVVAFESWEEKVSQS
jgi:hypothetical protein